MRTLSSLAATATTLGVLIVAAAPAGAAGWPKTLVVDQTAGPYTTINAALQDAVKDDTIDVHAGTYVESVLADQTHGVTIHGEPGAVIQAPPGAPFAVTVSGTSITLDHLTINGGDGGVLMGAFYDEITNSTITAPNTAVEMDGPFAFAIDRSVLRATAPSGVALRATTVATPDFPEKLDVSTSVLAGGPAGSGLSLVSDGSKYGGDGVAATLTSSTVAGAPTALTSAQVAGGGPNSFTAYNSIVHGAAPGLTGWRNETAATDAATFAGGGADGDFHVCSGAPAVGYTDANPRPAVLRAPTSPAFATTTDLDGVARSGDGAAPGAYEPTGTSCAATTPDVKHAAKDVTAPTVRITRQAKVRRFRLRTVKHHHVANRVRFGGHVGDASGVAGVQLVLRRLGGRAGTCRYLSPAKRRVVTTSCKATGPAVRAAVHGTTWSWKIPAGYALPAGRWQLQAVATDRAGNVATSVLHFTVT
ncbi:hypothetical protein [Conexibacter woesei]|uniref:hypothetical protein n=1 Tax=Conexibacter woesei TaxID=191495 RepID=UPI0012DDAC52|nr:hypothetical protein [Conexibacter woesei]